jgi:hypothetical protein
MRINYIPVFYFGTRRTNNPKDKYYFLKKHLDFLQELEEDSPIEATLVFNVSSSTDEPEANEIISHYNFKIPFETTFRENSGYSYAGWNHALRLNIPHNFDYSFLILDYYIHLFQTHHLILTAHLDIKQLYYRGHPLKIREILEYLIIRLKI